MKKLLLLLLFVPLVASSRMFPTEFPIKAVCWDSIEEAIEYHQDILGEYPIGKGWIDRKDEPSFAAIMYKDKAEKAIRKNLVRAIEGE